MSSASIREQLLGAYGRQGWRGFDRLLKASGHRAGDRIRARTRYGTWFELDPWSYIDRIVLREGYYESEVLLALVHDLQDGGVLWDVGANIGLHSITAKRLAPAAQVVCFEPSPSAVGRLWRHLTMNGLQAEVVSMALSDRTGYARLNIASPGNNGMTSLERLPDRDYVGECLVRTAPGDELIEAGLPAPTVMKIDVEGHEYAVLGGMERILSSGQCGRVIFEDAPGETMVKGRLRQFGYQIAPLSRREHSETAVQNYLALKA